jgi:large subunit ribosomal protein L22
MGKLSTMTNMHYNQAVAKSTYLRTSPRKLGLVAGLIRGLHISDAMVQLTFCKKRIAKDVKKCLQSAIANAENNHNLNIEDLYVAEVQVGKSVVMKRIHARARGRAGGIKKFFSNISITVREGSN